MCAPSAFNFASPWSAGQPHQQQSLQSDPFSPSLLVHRQSLCINEHEPLHHPWQPLCSQGQTTSYILQRMPAKKQQLNPHTQG